MMDSMLTKSELKRYERQISIFAEEGQEKLKNAKVFIAGAGGLGSVISIYLTVAGVGRIGMVDHDTIELSNLNRQILHWNKDIGKRKAASAKQKLQEMNPDVGIETTSETIDEKNVLELIGDSQLVVDAMDNFYTRYVLNRAAIAKNIPFFHGAINGLYGQVTTIIPGRTACLRCIFPVAPLQETFPVLGVTAGIIGLIQATEVIKYILGMGELLENRLLLWDGLNAMMSDSPIERNPRCKDCG